ncbi:SHOCT domain-containing protein [Cellulosimicrobium marinum]|uniref:SHOCT domain-containing protein n=1 Tax=Cellulosimicrobium marinum TaxID=1638992 RepID=UPI001E647FC3|nr:SHOCT domain-containing protein [Cellulosimicrobium marinum]MCB7137520.1 SHOCT domain-containing protein [Cellulosimicrobium marinum]
MTAPHTGHATDPTDTDPTGTDALRTSAPATGAPAVEAPGPVRRSVGLVRPPTVTAPTRRTTDLRYPAMFHVAGGRLVWDGAHLRLATPHTPVPTTAPPAAAHVTVTVTDTVVVHLHPPRPATTAPASATTRVVVLDRSATRFVDFARALHAAHPGTVTLDDRTVPSPRTPRLRPDAPGTRRRPGVFTRTLWRVRAATGTGPRHEGADLVDALERLAVLRRAGDLTAAQFEQAKTRLLE